MVALLPKLGATVSQTLLLETIKRCLFASGGWSTAYKLLKEVLTAIKVDASLTTARLPGRTDGPLHWACQFCHDELCKLLIDHGWDFSEVAVPSYGDLPAVPMSPYQMLVDLGHKPLAERIQRHAADVAAAKVAAEAAKKKAEEEAVAAKAATATAAAGVAVGSSS
jgi:Ankyrin repeats (many copies)